MRRKKVVDIPKSFSFLEKHLFGIKLKISQKSFPKQHGEQADRGKLNKGYRLFIYEQSVLNNRYPVIQILQFFG